MLSWESYLSVCFARLEMVELGCLYVSIVSFQCHPSSCLVHSNNKGGKAHWEFQTMYIKRYFAIILHCVVYPERIREPSERKGTSFKTSSASCSGACYLRHYSSSRSSTYAYKCTPLQRFPLAQAAGTFANIRHPGRGSWWEDHLPNNVVRWQETQLNDGTVVHMRDIAMRSVWS